MRGDRPKSRREGMLVRDLGDEAVVYDLETHQARCLNRTAALVWRACDGRTSIPAIASQVARALGTPPDESVVRYAVGRLRRARLLEPADDDAPTLSRREVARRLGRAALVPVVVSLLAPRPSDAATCVSNCVGKADNTQCSYGPQASCASDVCCGQSCCDACPGGVPQLPCF